VLAGAKNNDFKALNIVHNLCICSLHDEGQRKIKRRSWLRLPLAIHPYLDIHCDRDERRLKSLLERSILWTQCAHCPHIYIRLRLLPRNYHDLFVLNAAWKWNLNLAENLLEKENILAYGKTRLSGGDIVQIIDAKYVRFFGGDIISNIARILVLFQVLSKLRCCPRRITEAA